MPSSYLRLSEAEWAERLEALQARLTPCRLCPRECGADRSSAPGLCRAPLEIKISSANLHFGEEPPISGSRGSGTIFLSHCNLRCVFCQNFPISQLGNGKTIHADDLADHFLRLQAEGAHNINFVTPTPYTAQVIDAVHRAARKGFTLPLVWNSNGYESVETLALLEGIVDLYLPDLKYSEEAPAVALSRASGYFEVATRAVSEMWRQVGELETDEEGIGIKGLLVRHLVLPEDRSGTREVLRFLAQEISPLVTISLMAQYFPAHEATGLPGMDRRLTEEEYDRALGWLEEFGLENGYTQESELRFC